MSSYAEKYAEPVKRISANGKEYTVSPLIQRDLRPWVKELRDAKIMADIADVPPMKPDDRSKLIQKIRATEFTPDNLRWMVGNGNIDAVIRVLELAGTKLGLSGSDLESFVDGKSTIQNEKDAYRISGLFFPDDYVGRFRDETPGYVIQMFNAAAKGDEAELIRLSKEAAAIAKENERLTKEAEANAIPNDPSQT